MFVMDGVAVIEEVKVAVSEAVMLPVAVLVRLLLGVCVSLADGDAVCSEERSGELARGHDDGGERRRGVWSLVARQGTSGRGCGHGPHNQAG